MEVQLLYLPLQQQNKIMTGKKVVCWNCRGKGITEEGDTQDGFKISPDTECWLCEGTGQVIIGSKKHIEYREMCMPNTPEFKNSINKSK